MSGPVNCLWDARGAALVLGPCVGSTEQGFASPMLRSGICLLLIPRKVDFTHLQTLDATPGGPGIALPREVASVQVHTVEPIKQPSSHGGVCCAPAESATLFRPCADHMADKPAPGQAGLGTCS